MSVQGSWLLRGYFDLSGEDPHHTTTQTVRDLLSKSIGRALRIAGYPIGPNWRHTFWWREGREDYAEAQFFMRIDRDCPVLSLGVSVEKGLEDKLGGSGGADPDQMDRRTWDWQRLVDHRVEMLQTDVPEVARALSRAVNIRVRSYSPGHTPRAECRTFSFVSDRWFKRHHGTAEVLTIASHLETLDRCVDQWVDVYCGIDLDPAAAEGLTAEAIASLLLRFNLIRRKLSPRPADDQGTNAHASSGELILKVGTEGGSLSVRLVTGQGSTRRFVVLRDEETMRDFLHEEDQEGLVFSEEFPAVDTLPAALQIMDRYPWHRLTPLVVHPEDLDAVMGEVRRRGGETEVERWQFRLALDRPSVP